MLRECTNGRTARLWLEGVKQEETALRAEVKAQNEELQDLTNARDDLDDEVRRLKELSGAQQVDAAPAPAPPPPATTRPAPSDIAGGAAAAADAASAATAAAAGAGGSSSAAEEATGDSPIAPEPAAAPAAPCAHELAFDASGRTLAAAGADGEIRVFDVAAGKLVCKWRAHPRGHAATSVAFASDGGETRVFGVGTDGVVAEWSLRAASARGPIRAVDVRDACGVDTRTRLALDPRGRGAALTSAIANGAVAVFEGTRGAENGGRAVSLPGRGAAARCVDWHPTRSAVLAGCVDGTSMLTTLEMS